MSVRPVIVVHGGAGAHSAILHDKTGIEELHNGVIAAARAGYDVLQDAGLAIDAVQAAVMSMENNPNFNAGVGSCLTIDGRVEMDASIMDGRTLRAGAVTLITNVSNPVHVARLVMDKSDHVLLGGAGAVEFARKQGVPIIDNEFLVTEKSRRRLQQFQDFNPSVKVEFDRAKHGSSAENLVSSERDTVDDSHDTVGAVALDTQGNVAYATSTGGINAKMTGRIGDSPLVGAGGYCDNRVGAVSTTGHGESFIKMASAKHVCVLLEHGIGLDEAVRRCLDEMETRVGGQGGMVGVDMHGNTSAYFSTPGMSWCSIKDNLISYGIYKNECFQRQI